MADLTGYISSKLRKLKESFMPVNELRNLTPAQLSPRVMRTLPQAQNLLQEAQRSSLTPLRWGNNTSTFGQLLNEPNFLGGANQARLEQRNFNVAVPQKVPFLQGNLGFQGTEVTLPKVTFNKNRDPGLIRGLSEGLVNLPATMAEWQLGAPVQAARSIAYTAGDLIDVATGKDVKPQKFVADSADALSAILALQFFWKQPGITKTAGRIAEQAPGAIYNRLPAALKRGIIKRAIETAVDWGPYATKEAFFDEVKKNQDKPTVQAQLMQSVLPAIKQGIIQTAQAMIFKEGIHQGGRGVQALRHSVKGGAGSSPPTLAQTNYTPADVGTQVGSGKLTTGSFASRAALNAREQGQISKAELANIMKTSKSGNYPVADTSKTGAFRAERFATPTNMWNAQSRYFGTGKASTKLTEPKFNPQAGFINMGAMFGKKQPPPIQPKVNKLSEMTPAEQVQLTPVQKIIGALREAQPIRGEQQKLYSLERAKRVARVAGVGGRVGGEKGYFAQLGQLKGKLPRAEFESIRRGRWGIKQTDIDDLFNTVERHGTLMPLEKVTAKGGLAKLLGAGGGEVPTRGEIALLHEVFGKEFTKAMLSRRTVWQKIVAGSGEALNLPRSIMATADVSAPFRQGLFLSSSHPKRFAQAFGSMFKYLGSEKAYQGLHDDLVKRPTYQAMRQSGLAITNANSPLLQAREEAFMSNWAEKIFGFGKIAKASNRAYSGFLTKLRADVFDDLYRNAESQGLLKIRPQIAEHIANFVNSGTGRGAIRVPGFGSLQGTKALERSAVALNSFFFSPRLMASRINLLDPTYYMRLDPFVRKQALKSLFTFAATGLTITGLAKMAGADVEADPRSADFGKWRFGNTRYDPWGGFQQYIRAGAQIISGQRINSETGAIYDLGKGYKSDTRFDIALKFLESKEAPLASLVATLFKGQDTAGRPINVPAEVVERFIPMLWQDVYDLSKEHGVLQGIAMGAPAAFGVGVLNYGKQVPNIEKTPTGKPTVKLKEAPGLPEDIVGLFTRKPYSNVPESEQQQLVFEKSLEKAQKALKTSINETLADEDLSEEQKSRKIEKLKINFEKYHERLKEQTGQGQPRAALNTESALADEDTSLPTYYKDESGNFQILDLDKIIEMPTKTAYDRALKNSEAWDVATKLESSDLNDQQLETIYEKLGITAPDATYYSVARQEEDIRGAYVNDVVTQTTPEELLPTLAQMRREVNSKKILTDALVTDLVEQGTISKEQGKYLKQIKNVSAKGILELKPSSGGKGRKPRKLSINLSNTVRIPQLPAPVRARTSRLNRARRVSLAAIKGPKRQKVTALRAPRTFRPLKLQQP